MKRHTLLTVLCVLTFINTLFAIVSNIAPALAYDWFVGYLEKAMDAVEGTLADQLQLAIDNVGKAGSWYFATLLIISIATFVSAVFMWQRKKLGVTIYTACQFVLLITPTLFGVEKFPGISNLIFAVLFVVLYHYAFKLTRQLNEDLKVDNEETHSEE